MSRLGSPPHTYLEHELGLGSIGRGGCQGSEGTKDRALTQLKSRDLKCLPKCGNFLGKAWKLPAVGHSLPLRSCFFLTLPQVQTTYPGVYHSLSLYAYVLWSLKPT